MLLPSPPLSSIFHCHFMCLCFLSPHGGLSLEHRTAVAHVAFCDLRLPIRLHSSCTAMPAACSPGCAFGAWPLAPFRFSFSLVSSETVALKFLDHCCVLL